MALRKDQKDEVHARLIAWGEAAAGGVAVMPGCSALVTMVPNDGGRGGRVLWSVDVDEVEHAVCRLPEDERAVIKEFYTVLDATVAQHCRALGMSSSRAYRLRDSAIVRIAKTLQDFRCCA